MPWTRDQLAERAAKELQDGYYVNLGIGIPTLVANHIPPGMDVTLQSENGMLGIGPFPFEGEEDPDLINAGKQTITSLPRSSYFDSATSFSMIRGGHIDLCILGALQVAGNGDLANWLVPGKMVKGPGGAMDLVAGVKRVVVVMEQTVNGQSKLVDSCTLPLTGQGVVDRVITDYGVYDIDEKGGGFVLRELAPGMSLEDAKAHTAEAYGCAFVTLFYSIPLTPELCCTDIQQSLDFYVGVLGFTIQYQRAEDGFAMLERQGARLMLDQLHGIDGKGRSWLTGPLEKPFGRGINLQIQTSDVDALYEKARKANAPIFLPMEEKWYRREDILLGNRQFIVQDPDGYLLRFFEGLGEKKTDD